MRADSREIAIATEEKEINQTYLQSRDNEYPAQTRGKADTRFNNFKAVGLVEGPRLLIRLMGVQF